MRGCRLWSLGAFELAPCLGAQFYAITGKGFGGMDSRDGGSLLWGPTLGVFGRLRLLRPARFLSRSGRRRTGRETALRVFRRGAVASPLGLGRPAVRRSRGAILKASHEPWPLHLNAPEGAKVETLSRDLLPETLAQIYEAHFDFVWRNARRLGVPEASADDVTQDVFMVVQRRIADFDGRGPIQAWIFGICVRVVRDHRRSFRRKGERNVPLDHEIRSGTSARSRMD